MWPFRRGRADRGPASSPGLEAITADTPRRFSITLAGSEAADRAVAELRARLPRELEVTHRSDGSGGAVLDLLSNLHVGNAAVLRPLNVLRRGGIEVVGVEAHALVTDVDDKALRRAVEDWAVNANTGPYRKRLEHLAGEDLLRRTIEIARTVGADHGRRRSAWWLAVKCVVFNTPGAEALAITEAAHTGEEAVALSMIDAAIDRVTLVRLAGMPATVPTDDLALVLRRPGYLAERACHLVIAQRSAVEPAVAAALRDLVPRGGHAAAGGLAALHEADPSAELRATVDTALASNEPETQAAALALLARHWPADARPVWHDFLASRSAPLRMTAESVIGLHGSEEDLPDAAAQLKKVSRGTGIESWPPRGHEIVDLLVRHREHPVARAALDDLTARWPRLRDDLRRWLVDQHSHLQPSVEVAAADAMSTDEPGDESLTWPPPGMVRDGDSIGLTFDEGSAHSPARERFEELVEREPFEVLESDREFLRVRAPSTGAEGRLRELWDEASSAPPVTNS